MMAWPAAGHCLSLQAEASTSDVMVCAVVQLEQSLAQMHVIRITSTTQTSASSQPYPNFHVETIFSSFKRNRSKFVCNLDEKEPNPGLLLGACQVAKKELAS